MPERYIIGTGWYSGDQKGRMIKMKHLLKMLDLSTEEIFSLLNLADQLKYEQKHGKMCIRDRM